MNSRNRIWSPYRKYGLDVTNLNAINGYQFNEKFYAGIGTGYKYLNENKSSLIPLYLDLKYYFSKGAVSPLWEFSAGYTFNPDKGFKGEGFVFNPFHRCQHKRSENAEV